MLFVGVALLVAVGIGLLVSADAELLVTSPPATPGAGWSWLPGQVSG